ncbi:MAG TPA: RHS repeat-associated core domain-containing protein, partial [Planctomycetes bacterium]|nr:RHS repeat-associated core domain-containing protein [Planctomycetota bacterium]
MFTAPGGPKGQATLVLKWAYDSLHRKATYLPPEGNASANPSLFQVTYTRATDQAGVTTHTASIPARDGRSTPSVWTIKVTSGGKILEWENPSSNLTGNGKYIRYEYYSLTNDGNSLMPKRRYFRKGSNTIYEEYQWNKRGRLVQVTDNQGYSQTMSYDSNNERIVWEGFQHSNQRYRHEWSWDAEGRLGQLRWLYFPDPPGQGVAQSSWIAWDYLYDEADNLIKLEKDLDASTRAVTQFSYDAIGRRKTKTVGSVPTRYLYAGSSMIAEYRKVGTGAEALDAIHFQGSGVDDMVMSRRVDRADLDADGSTTDWVDLYFHQDRLGSTKALTLGSNGTVVESYDYDPFGKPKIFDKNGQQTTAPPSGNPFLFTGREYDQETGFYDYRSRTYDPATGTFLQEDPLGMEDDLNPVVYALSNPVSFTDPMGTLSIREAVSGLFDFMKANADILGDMVVGAIPFLEEILDIISALSGRDITSWIKGGLQGEPAEMGWWDCAVTGASAAIKLAGSAFGILTKVKKVFEKIQELVDRATAKAVNLVRKVNKRAGDGLCKALGGKYCFVAGT